MKTLIPTLSLILLTFSAGIQAQNQPSAPRGRVAAARSSEIGRTAVVIDETLSVLRERPSLLAKPVQRMRRGRTLQILKSTEADGVRFFKVAAPLAKVGWMQADAVVGKFRAADEERLAGLVQALDGFDQIEAAVEFFKLYPASKFRPSILLLFGDLLEEVAVKLSRDASHRLSRREMAASQAPMHSYYLNFNMLDRYRRLGVVFLFNPATRHFYYSGASWKEIVTKFPASAEAQEAKKRLDALKVKMEKTATT